MWGLGADGLHGLRRLLQQTKAERGYALSDLIILVSMTVAEWSYTGYQAEMYALPLFAKHKLRVVQIVKGGPHVKDGYVVLSDSRDPRKLWLYGWATPPLSPMSEGIPYHAEPLYSPLHPLWSPEAVWDLAYHPEHFGPPDPYACLDKLPGALSGRLIYHVRRTHRHYVSRLPGFDPSFALKAESDVCSQQIQPLGQRLEHAGMGSYYAAVGSMPQFSEASRECSPKFKGTLLDDCAAELATTAEQGHFDLGANLLRLGQVPQFAAAGRLYSNQYKDPDTVEGTYGLGESIIQSGCVPQVSQGKGRGKCSDKHKAVTCNQWLGQVKPQQGLNTTPNTHWKAVESDRRALKYLFHKEGDHVAVPLPPFVTVIIFFNGDEQRRQDRAEFAISKKQARKQPVRPTIYRIDRFPLLKAAIGRAEIELENQRDLGEAQDRSACSCCPFFGICGPSDEVLGKHRAMPNESGFSLFLENGITRRLNERQTLYPDGRAQLDLVQDDGNWEALMNYEARLAAVPWALYRVQRLTGGTPYRRTQVLQTGTQAAMDVALETLCKQLGGSLIEGERDGVRRGWIEFREYRRDVVNKKGKPVSTRFTVQDLLVVCPHVVEAKHRPGWERVWEEAHSQRQSVFDWQPPAAPTTMMPV